MRRGESNYRFTPFVEHRGAFKLNGTTGDFQPARRIKAPKVADSSSSGLLGKFGNTQPIHKRHRQGSRAPD